MNTLEALERRHSTRAYTDEPVGDELLQRIQHEIDECNLASGLHLQMVAGNADAFNGYKTHYGRFSNVHNAIALVGKGAHAVEDLKSAQRKPEDSAPLNDAEAKLQTVVGYFGERLSIFLVQLGLDTSWAVLDNAGEGWWTLNDDEHVIWVLAFGHASRLGNQHRSKPISRFCELPQGMVLPDQANVPALSSSQPPSNAIADTNTDTNTNFAPQWFINGVSAAMRAPTSLNQQPFVFTLHDDLTVSAQATEGLFAHVGLGCAVYNFEVGTGQEQASQFRWQA